MSIRGYIFKFSNYLIFKLQPGWQRKARSLEGCFLKFAVATNGSQREAYKKLT